MSEKVRKRKSPNKVLFISVNEKSLGGNLLRQSNKLRDILLMFRESFPDHEVIIISEVITRIEEYSDGELRVMYGKERNIPYKLGDGIIKADKPWWDMMPMSYNMVNPEESKVSKYEDPFYQTNIYDYLGRD